MKRRLPTPKQIDAAMAEVAKGRNPEYRVRSTAIRTDEPTQQPKLANVIVRAELLLAGLVTTAGVEALTGLYPSGVETTAVYFGDLVPLRTSEVVRCVPSTECGSLGRTTASSAKARVRIGAN